MKKIILLISFSFICTPLMAGTIQLFNYNGDSWVVGTASGDGTFKINYELDNLPDSFAVINPARSEKAWRWTGSGVEYASTGKTIPPSPSEAIGQIRDHFIEVENDTTAGLNRMDNLLNNYPTVSQAIEQETWGIYRNRIEQAAKNDDINDTESHNLKAISKGTY